MTKTQDEPTPGEWSAIREHMYGLPDAWRIVSALGVTVALIEPTAPTMSASEVEANARLFAASKELLAVCKEALESWDDGSCRPGYWDRLRLAIAKAEGES